MGCDREETLLSWERSGAGAPCPPELEAHAEGCGTCGPRLREVLSTRGWFADLPGGELPERRHEQMRFALMAAARNAKPASEPRRTRRLPLVVAGGLALAAAAALLLAFFVGSSPEGGAPAVASATVELEDGARGHVVPPPSDVSYRLIEGGARFDVPRQREGTHYRVRAGEAVVEVRGTRFRLVVEDGHLASARVSEGHVVVSIDGRKVADLRAGDAWRRPPDELAAAPADDDMAQAGAPGAGASPSAGDPGDRGAEPGDVGALDRRARAAGGDHRPDRGSAPTAADRAAARGASVVRPEPELPPAPAGFDADAAFTAAWRTLRGGDAAGAARDFDALLAADLDHARRADVLYWSAEAHARAGHRDVAIARANQLLRAYPHAWRVRDARLLLDRLAAPAPSP
jgi:hypothetical protein